MKDKTESEHLKNVCHQANERQKPSQHLKIILHQSNERQKAEPKSKIPPS
ncbi:hypothetical protein [Ureibacillus chungkukjangi]|nr:hypothetical protein [Ureibacillus chungkukjangi]